MEDFINLDNSSHSVDGYILVTGATGLVGSHLVQALAEQGKKIKALYRSTIPDYRGSEKVTWIKGDILDTGSLEEAMQDVLQVYHCAGMVSFDPKEKQALHKINIEGTATVVNACINAEVKKLLFVSSVSALGRIRQNEIITEQMNWTEETSNSEYGKTKFLAEMEVWRGTGEGLNAVIVNPTIILGAADWNKGSAAIFKNVYNRFPWYTEGITGFTDVADVVNAMIGLMNSNVCNERFIISAENISYRELFNNIADAFGVRQPYKKVTPFIAAVVWRLEAVKAMFSGKKPLLTKETSKTAQTKVYFDNNKLLQYIPQFKYTVLQNSISRICGEFKKMYNLG